MLDSERLFHVLLALFAITMTGRVLGAAFRRIGQPRVIGEVVAGSSLGPSLLGRIWPDAMTFVLPSAISPVLGMIAQLGVILYMFLIGLGEATASLTIVPSRTLGCIRADGC